MQSSRRLAGDFLLDLFRLAMCHLSITRTCAIAQSTNIVRPLPRLYTLKQFEDLTGATRRSSGCPRTRHMDLCEHCDQAPVHFYDNGERYSLRLFCRCETHVLRGFYGGEDPIKEVSSEEYTILKVMTT